MQHKSKLFIAVAAVVIASAAGAQTEDNNRIDPVTHKIVSDLTGRARTGVASFYADMFFGRKMADGSPMDPRGDNAASLTLPLGTRARVTNTQTGQSAVVTIQDRGPYVKGRLIDLSPATARAIGITPKMGLAKVEVTPIYVPLPNGRVRWGEGSQVALATGEMPVQ
jgi:rare lipoprotein A